LLKIVQNPEECDPEFRCARRSKLPRFLSDAINEEL